MPISSWRNLCGPRMALRATVAAALVLPAARDLAAQTPGAYGNGLSAAALGRGATVAAGSDDPSDAVQANPAGIAGATAPAVSLSALGVLAFGSFRNSVDANGSIAPIAGAVPYGAIALPIGHRPSPVADADPSSQPKPFVETGLWGTRGWTAVFALTPESLMRASWQYIDPPGTAGVSYGAQKNESKIVAYRASTGVACNLGPAWSAGVTLGLVYNRNLLHAPYIFQQQPELAGLKVLLNLKTQGYGWNGSIGTQWRPTSALRLGGFWKSETAISTDGTAKGSASALFDALAITASPLYAYGSHVEVHLPQSAGAGVVWRQSPRLQWAADGDWIGWKQAFHVLPVKLTDGSNAVIDSVATSANLEDIVQLQWHNQGMARVGAAYSANEIWSVRAGYAYQSNPVPAATVTPLTASILRNSIDAGAGYRRGNWTWDVAYQAQLPASESVTKSELLAGEYDNSRVHVMTQSLTLTARWSPKAKTTAK